MSQNPVTQTIRIVLATLFLFWLLLLYRDGHSEEFAVPYLLSIVVWFWQVYWSTTTASPRLALRHSEYMSYLRILGSLYRRD